MALVGMCELLQAAKRGNYAVGSFSVGNMEMTMGVLAAAEELKAPVILQIAESRLCHSPLELIGPLMVAAAKKATVPVAVHFDHGVHVEAIVQALSLGFTSVMFDGSHLSLEENITYTKQVRLLANAYGAAVEGEIGRVGGTEDGKGTACLYSRAKDAAQFCAETGVDALAVAIGNAHGVYKGEPALRFDLLGEILHAVETPLVLHGGTGISKDGFCACVRGGIRKINIATANFNAVDTALKLHYGKETSGGYFAASSCMVNAVRDKVRELILIFGSDGRVS